MLTKHITCTVFLHLTVSASDRVADFRMTRGFFILSRVHPTARSSMSAGQVLLDVKTSLCPMLESGDSSTFPLDDCRATESQKCGVSQCMNVECSIGSGKEEMSETYAFVFLPQSCFQCTTFVSWAGVDTFVPQWTSSALLCHVFVPINVNDLPDGCFSGCKLLSWVGFGASSRLERIGAGAFAGTNLREVWSPGNVKELCDQCFAGCKTLSRVSFGATSCLERIGTRAFSETRLCDIVIPDSVKELCDGCFGHCNALSRVSFGVSSCLERIGGYAFQYTGLISILLPDIVKAVGYMCFFHCMMLSHVSVGASSRLEHIHEHAFSRTNLVEVLTPDSVKEHDMDASF